MAFLALEGIDASGKSTLLDRLYEKLKAEGLDPVRTKEPGGTKIGSAIREILLEKENKSLDPLAETLLYYTDRKQHVEEIIKPALKKNRWLLSDRYWASTSAYQCGGRGINEDFVQQLKNKICGDCDPHLWILLDLPVEQSLTRLQSKDGEQLDWLRRDRLEMEDSCFHQRVRDYYLKLSRKEPEKWLILDSTQPAEKLLDQTWSHLRQKEWFKV